MNSSMLARFYKQATCPSSELLLAYHDSTLSGECRSEVAAHLSECDFCCAELRLLAEHYTAHDEVCMAESMPLSLRHLAEALLSRQALSMERFIEATYEKEGLTLTDA
ncbi:MAG TPA: hypothetical protein VGB17_01580 [Pyrinomonadaceae bacterium]|jgi:anti-sigma factor RsiW